MKRILAEKKYLKVISLIFMHHKLRFDQAIFSCHHLETFLSYSCLRVFPSSHLCGVTSIKQSWHYPFHRVNRMITKAFGTQWPALGKHLNLGTCSPAQGWARHDRHSEGRADFAVSYAGSECVLPAGSHHRGPWRLCVHAGGGLNSVSPLSYIPGYWRGFIATTTRLSPLGLPLDCSELLGVVVISWRLDTQMPLQRNKWGWNVLSK